MSTPKLVEDFYERIWNDGIWMPQRSYSRRSSHSCVAEENQAFAKMYFSGRDVAAFRGYEPTGKLVQWLGAALFRFEDSMIAELWVVGDRGA